MKKTTLEAQEFLIDHIRELAKEVPVEELGGALQKVAKARGITGAQIELRFAPTDAPYYNVYRYAFFGMVPEKEPPVVISGKLSTE